jgi:hypothetical protein
VPYIGDIHASVEPFNADCQVVNAVWAVSFSRLHAYIDTLYATSPYGTSRTR